MVFFTEEEDPDGRENRTVFMIPDTLRNTDPQCRWEYLKGGAPDCASMGSMSSLQDEGSSSEDTLSHDLERWTWDIHSIILDLTTANFIDTVAINTLRNIFRDFGEISVDVYMAGCQGIHTRANFVYSSVAAMVMVVPIAVKPPSTSKNTLSILVNVKEMEDLFWAEVQFLHQLLLAFLHHQLAFHQTFQLCKLHHYTTLVV
ncbi:hypothetical protein CRUP_006739 [Coryphaenoides rupestris]|nr:hypothetical protein CRUP_006739 [Coryphaenoides rupestris]